jgi:formylglycine-generating enzyme required for sulfatase activity
MPPLPPCRWLAVVLVSSIAAGLVLLAPGLAEAPVGKKYALLVGVREYDSGKLTNLKYTENDVEDLAGVLARQGGFSVRLLTTSRGAMRSTDAPTVANLRAEIKKLLADKKRNDTVLVALAGHGIQGKVKEKDESFFCPADAQLNDDSKLLALGQLFKDLDGCGAGIKLLLVDACRNDPAEGRNVDIETLPRLPRGTAALFSCSSGERAFETAKLGKGHGVFFFHVLAGLEGKARNADGEVTWGGLAEYVTRSVSVAVPKLIGEGAQQTPELKVNLRGASPVLVASVKGWGSEIENSIGIKLVRIPAGKFTMGSPADEKDRRDDEQQHEVEITKDFWLGVTEVTQKQFQDVMGFNPSFFSRGGAGKPGEEYKYAEPAGGKDKVSGSTADFPVENLSWQDAVDFCNKLSARAAESGRKYRLPTEAEWEYSCRGEASSSYRVFHFGNSLSSSQANFDGNYPYGEGGKGDYLERTCKVGSYTKNRFGLYDMHGNVWEWGAAWSGSDYYGKSPPRDPLGPSEGSYRVFRGGSWFSRGRACRSAHRYYDSPTDRCAYLGFRVVLVPAGP